MTRIDGDPSTEASIAVDFASPLNFACAFRHRGTVTTGAIIEQMPIHLNLTDSNGNGILIATQSIVIVGANVSGATAGTYTAKVLYRLVEVGIQEYVGIVQSQQG